jgi:hypothetical protein
MKKRFEASRIALLEQELAATADAHTVNTFLSSIASDPVTMIPLFLSDVQEGIDCGLRLLRDAEPGLILPTPEAREKTRKKVQILLKLKTSAFKYFTTLGIDWNMY